MRIVVLLGLAFIGIAGFAVASQAEATAEPNALGYHQRVGIPEAERIKKTEELILRNYNHDNRIVGGIVSQINAHPHLAGLVINLVNTAGLSVCGSSLLTNNRLVTAAHCWFDGVNQAWQYTVVLGSQMIFTGGLRITTTQVFMHPEWIPSLIANDVAMIYLPQPISYTTAIQPVALPSGNLLFDSFVGEWGIAAGFGKTSDHQIGVSPTAVISEVHLQVISVAQCQATFGHFARDTNICTSGIGGVGLCGGDSGGPLIVNRFGQTYLVGISSFVAANGCELGHPSAFARVTSFHNFIVQHLMHNK